MPNEKISSQGWALCNGTKSLCEEMDDKSVCQPNKPLQNPWQIVHAMSIRLYCSETLQCNNEPKITKWYGAAGSVISLNSPGLWNGRQTC